MRAVVTLLVLLLSICGAQTELHKESQSTGAAAATTQLDVSAELRELRDIVVEQRVTLKFTRDELQNTKDLLHKIEAENYAKLTALENRLAATETEVLNLKKEITKKPKVAFSAGLTNSGRIESGTTELNLVFTRIITNVGQAYSDMTGFFTAPVGGVYYFRFTVMDTLKHYVQIKMFKNGEQIMYLFEYKNTGYFSYVSGGVTLQLGAGDVVNLRLPAGYIVYDSSDNHSIFNGFLLFPL